MKRLAALLLAILLLLSACAVQEAAPAAETPAAGASLPSQAAPAALSSEPEAAEASSRTMPLLYATQFSVEYEEDGTALITVGNTDRFLLTPEGMSAPSDLEADVTPLYQPLGTLYVAASGVMDLFLQLNSLSQVRMTSTTLNNWAIPEVRSALESGEMIYAGKYSAPDFELLLSEHCSLAVENTMIYHSPDIREQIISLGIPVIVERSSYEKHPLGRVEWIKLYGLLLGKEAEAEAFFREQLSLLEGLESLPAGEVTVAYFHINTLGAAVVRKPGDYVSRMIEMAGGKYVFDSLPGQDENALSTMNMQMEAFYAGAKNADVLIYNSTIAGELETVDQLLEKSSLLADFKAVQNGSVWCSEHDFYQRSSASAAMIRELNLILSGETEGEDLTFFHRLK